MQWKDCYHWYTDFLLSKSYNGELRRGRFGRNLIYWLIEPKNERNSEIFFEIGWFLYHRLFRPMVLPRFRNFEPEPFYYLLQKCACLLFTAILFLSKDYWFLCKIALSSTIVPLKAIRLVCHLCNILWIRLRICKCK